MTKKPVTFLVYMAADNSLYSFADADIQEMAKIGSNNNVAILVYLCTKKPGQKKITVRYEIRKGRAVQIGFDQWQDSGDYKTVQKACQWALSQYPCDCFILDFWNHGSGSLNRAPLMHNLPLKMRGRAVCYDDTTGHFLTDIDLQTIAQFVTKLRNGKKLDIIAFDACLMSDIEIAYALAPYTNYMVASQETIPGPGFGYDLILSQMAAKTAPAQTHAINMVLSYQREYAQTEPSYTMAALDLSKINDLSTNTDQLARILKSLLEGPNHSLVKQAIQKSSALKYCTSFEEPSYLDMGHLYTNLLSNVDSMNLSGEDKATLQIVLNNGLSLLKATVISQVHGSAHPGATGLSIYLNQQYVDKAYDSLIWSSHLSWNAFLHTYVQTKGLSNTETNCSFS